MSYLVLARKWRPKTFQDLIGQEHIVRSLQNSIINKRIGHAYIFVGTRGVGKTSAARIFAKAIRCINKRPDGNACNECIACKDFDTDNSMNIIEIDGASNNSVDNIRDLISNVHYLPTSGEYKVYIIDEVHMLSTSAFNALLKTLEEPPRHVVFIFATTEGNKLLGTVLSRCQRFDFRNVDLNNLKEQVKKIAAHESIRFEKEQLIDELCKLGDGSVRDTLSLFDQVLTFSKNNVITEEVFSSSLGVCGPSQISAVVNAVFSGNDLELKKLFFEITNKNFPLLNFANSLSDRFYQEIEENKNYSLAELIWVFESFAKDITWALESLRPDKTFFILLLKLCKRRDFFGSISAGGNQEQVEIKRDGPTVKPVEEPVTVKTEKKTVEIKASFSNDKSWDEFLKYLNELSPASASNLEQGNLLNPISRKNGELYIELGFNFSGLVFLDYLKEAEVYQKLLSNLSDFFQVEKEKIKLALLEVGNEEEFVSKAEQKRLEEELSDQDKMEEIKNNPILKEAERIFNSKIDKVIIENKK